MTWWCKSHHREATDLRYHPGHAKMMRGCDPRLGGILLPCDAKEMTEAEIAEFERKAKEPRKPDYITHGGLLIPNPEVERGV